MSENGRKKKLIEVALPLDEINAACAADKAVKTGTIRNLHKWFAPMPLPAWRALLFAALIDDPGTASGREEALELVKELVRDAPGLPSEDVLAKAKRAIADQFQSSLPVVADPFCGAGSTLVEAQRLGLTTRGSDLNPVPVLISRTLTQCLPKVADALPLHAQAVEGQQQLVMSKTSRADPYSGITADFLHYAGLVEIRARKLLRESYPSPNSGRVPIAWIWGRTMRCPNPACGRETVLTTSWWLSKKAGRLAWIQPRITDTAVELDVLDMQRSGEAPPPPKPGRGTAFQCIGCGQVIPEEEVRRFGVQEGLGLRMMAVIEDSKDGRIHRAPTEDELLALRAVDVPDGIPDISLGPGNQYIAPPRFGIRTFSDLYTERQLATLACFADQVADVYSEIQEDGGSKDYADAVTSLLALAVGKMAQYGSTQTFLYTRNGPSAAKAAFGRADIPMTWDFTETSPFGVSIGSWNALCQNLLRALKYAPHGHGEVRRADARMANVGGEAPVLVATDPPYFDAIAYADLSDYFYAWHRRALKSVHPDLYGTLAAPKDGELSAFAWHHGGTKEAARENFISGFTETFRTLEQAPGDLPLLVVYASKEQKGGREEETRWSSILSAMIVADLEITGTWPIRGTTEARMRSAGSNAVSSYIVMVCRPRPHGAGTCSWSDFTRALRRELAPAVRDLQAASILPVDLAQAAMGPGMQIFSRYRAVLDQSGARVQVEQALRAINTALAEVLDEQEGELDPASRFAVRWWAVHGWAAGPFGDADKAARPLGISVDDVVRAQVATSKANKVELLGHHELDREWLPVKDIRPTAWEAVHHLADRLIDGGGELEASRLMADLGPLQDSAMALVYRLHDIAAKSSRFSDQERYNALISAWSELVKLGSTSPRATEGLF